jgi:acyl-CoA synthetase (AMP-forming)/AMP-acid ligase II
LLRGACHQAALCADPLARNDHSPVIMKGYLNQPAKTAETFWHDETGKRFVRTGDSGASMPTTFSR